MAALGRFRPAPDTEGVALIRARAPVRRADDPTCPRHEKSKVRSRCDPPNPG